MFSEGRRPGHPRKFVLHTAHGSRQARHRVHLEKFYVDVVNADGAGCIGYAARLDGFGFAATLAATLRWDADAARPPEQQRTLRGALPIVERDSLTWNCAPLNASGKWDTREPAGPELTLWSDARGSVRWQPLAPRASVTLTVDGRTITGWGYAERLRLDLPPWRLPIDGLIWGRFVSRTHSAVWIEWAHATPRRWLWLNGHECSGASISRTGVTWPGGRIGFGPPRTLRSGRLADTAFARWPRVRRWLPARVQAYDETKWCARGRLNAADGSEAEGWVIHEQVHFR